MIKLNILKDTSFEFALRIIQLYQDLQTSHKEYVLSKQKLLSGTSVGALLRKSENAASRKDFLNKLNVALKEGDETSYWLELLFQSYYIEQSLYNSLMHDCNEINKQFSCKCKTLKEMPGINLNSQI